MINQFSPSASRVSNKDNLSAPSPANSGFSDIFEQQSYMALSGKWSELEYYIPAAAAPFYSSTGSSNSFSGGKGGGRSSSGTDPNGLVQINKKDLKELLIALYLNQYPSYNTNHNPSREELEKCALEDLLKGEGHERSMFSLDFTSANIDQLGWTYATSIAALDEGNTFDTFEGRGWGGQVRRRRWKRIDLSLYSSNNKVLG